MTKDHRITLLEIAAIILTEHPDQIFTEVELFQEAQIMAGCPRRLDFKEVLPECNFLEFLEENQFRLK